MAYCFPPELQQLVRDELAVGIYSSEDELLLEAVRLLHRREEDLRNFKARFQGRLDRLDRGEAIELEDEAALQGFFDDVQTRGRQRYEASQATPS
jgi:Arc/MetJ-type ribon-helix-helix transcriptional regulator